MIQITSFLHGLGGQKACGRQGSVLIESKLYHYNTKSNITGLIDLGADLFVIYQLNRLHNDY